MTKLGIIRTIVTTFSAANWVGNNYNFCAAIVSCATRTLRFPARICRMPKSKWDENKFVWLSSVWYEIETLLLQLRTLGIFSTNLQLGYWVLGKTQRHRENWKPFDAENDNPINCNKSLLLGTWRAYFVFYVAVRHSSTVRSNTNGYIHISSRCSIVTAFWSSFCAASHWPVYWSWWAPSTSLTTILAPTIYIPDGSCSSDTPYTYHIL